MQRDEDTGFLQALVSDGRPLIAVTGLCLAMAGGFALFQSGTGHFLPHDVAYLQMEPRQLCSINQCRIVHFMIHDRVSFGGVIIAIGALYAWLATFPLRHGEAWAWWSLAASGLVGFGSFLTYLGYGYLDTWHGAATLILLPLFLLGMQRTWHLVQSRQASAVPAGSSQTFCASSWRALFKRAWSDSLYSRAGCGRALLLLTAGGMIGAGFTIQTIGMTVVFVPTDLSFMGLSYQELSVINPRLIPLIAHDRAGFGGGVACAGVLLFTSIWCAKWSRSLWQALLIAGIAGWSTSIGIHPLIGYTDAGHLAPAVLGALLFFLGMALMANEPKRKEGCV